MEIKENNRFKVDRKYEYLDTYFAVLSIFFWIIIILGVLVIIGVYIINNISKLNTSFVAWIFEIVTWINGILLFIFIPILEFNKYILSKLKNTENTLEKILEKL